MGEAVTRPPGVTSVDEATDELVRDEEQRGGD